MKEQVRIETDDLLNRAGGSNSYIPMPTGFIPAPGIPDALNEALAREDIHLTGASNPLLPMTFAIPGKDGVRAQVTLLINPENMNHGKTNSAQSIYTRGGWIPQLWGPNQDLITATGRSAVFMVSGEGASELLKKYSFAYLNFIALMGAYKNNGYRFNDQTNPRGRTRVAELIQGVEIYYDGQIFMGHFNNFTLDDTAEAPFIFSYNFEFVCSTVSDEYNYVRGHFLPLDGWKTNLDNTTDDNAGTGSNAQFEATVRSRGQSNPTSTLLYDVGSNGPQAKPTRTKQKTDDSVADVWEKATKIAFPPNGLPFSEAIRRGYTNGSYNQNMELRSQLLAAISQGSVASVFDR